MWKNTKYLEPIISVFRAHNKIQGVPDQRGEKRGIARELVRCREPGIKQAAIHGATVSSAATECSERLRVIARVGSPGVRDSALVKRSGHERVESLPDAGSPPSNITRVRRLVSRRIACDRVSSLRSSNIRLGLVQRKILNTAQLKLLSVTRRGRGLA